MRSSAGKLGALQGVRLSSQRVALLLHAREFGAKANAYLFLRYSIPASAFGNYCVSVVMGNSLQWLAAVYADSQYHRDVRRLHSALVELDGRGAGGLAVLRGVLTEAVEGTGTHR